MTIVVVDTSVVVSGLLTDADDAPTRVILDFMLTGRLRYALSVDLLAEYRETLLRPAIAGRHGLGEALLDKLLARLALGAIMGDPPAVGISASVDTATATDADTALVRDPGDAHVARLASSLPDVMVVTGDRRLREDLAPVCSVVSPAEYVSGRA
jgi:uncharacterized protein